MPSRCLGVPEILLQIFELVFAAKNRYPDLAGLARTCKAFNDPALAILWRTQSTLLPLVLCFPRDVLELSQIDDGAQQTVKFARPPSAQDWERPLVYAKYIKIIKFEHSSWYLENYELHSSVLRTLLDSCPTLPVLPRLRELDHSCTYQGHRASIDDATYMDALTRLSSSTTIQSLKFRFPTDVSADVAREYLREVMEHCKTIESFDARLARKSEQPLPLSEYFVGFVSLQKLQSLDVWNELDYASSRSTPPREISFPDSFTTLHNSFPSLVKLGLQQFSVSAIIDILRAIRSTNLRDVDFLAMEDNIGNLCSFLTSRLQWRESLRSIVIHGAILSAKDLVHLMALKNLRHLAIHTSMAPDDGIMEAAAKAWPMLEVLCIINEARSPEDVKATLKSLVSLRTYCSRLQYLQIRLDATEIPSLPSSSQTNHANTDVSHSQLLEGSSSSASQLSRLGSEGPPFVLAIDLNSAIRNSTGVAEFLMALFPRIQVENHFPFRLENQQWLALWNRVARVIDETLGQAPQPGASHAMFQAALPV